MPAKSNVDNFYGSSRKRRNLSSVCYDQDNEFEKNKITKLDSVTFNRNPNSDKEISKKKDVDESIRECTTVGFNQTLQN